MAESPAHKLGQFIGNLVESVIEPYLSDFAEKRNLYLDYQKRPRKTRKGKKVAWEDSYGNVHDLDYVWKWVELIRRQEFPLRLSKSHGVATRSIHVTRPKKSKGQFCL